MKVSIKACAGAVALATSLLAPAALAQTDTTAWRARDWQFTGIVYGWLPDIGGKSNFPIDTGGQPIDIDAGKIIDNLKFTFMGTFDAHKGEWGVFTDVIYLSVSGDKSHTQDFSLGSTAVPAAASADLHLGIKSWVWTLAGEYQLPSTPDNTLNLLAGARMLKIKETLDYAFSEQLGDIPSADQSGTVQTDQTFWDGIIGVKGRYSFGANHEWLVPYYADIGTGQSKLTWQAAIGVGYAFNWGDVVVLYRYLDYHMKSGSIIHDVNLGGPMAGVAFHW